jgi:hypothetical protein
MSNYKRVIRSVRTDNRLALDSKGVVELLNLETLQLQMVSVAFKRVRIMKGQCLVLKISSMTKVNSTLSLKFLLVVSKSMTISSINQGAQTSKNMMNRK